MIAGFSWVDWLLAAVLLVSTIIGLWRGLVYELLALVGWVVAFIAAQLWGAAVAPWLPFGAPDGLFRVGAAYGLVFIGTLIAWTLMAKLVRMMISATPLTVIDRALGVAFGFARGLLILLVVALVVTRIPPASRSTAWQSSHGAAWLGSMLNGLDPLWPRHHSTQVVGRA
jgi:membrane protein required for colicin V production